MTGWDNITFRTFKKESRLVNLPVIESPSEPLIRTELEEDIRIPVAITETFDRLGVDWRAQDTTLQYWLDADAAETLVRASAGTCRISTTVWGYPVVIREDQITVYPPQSAQETADPQVE